MKKYVKKAEKSKGKGQEEMDRVTAADIAFMGKYRKNHSGRRCHILTPGTRRPGLELTDLAGVCHAQLVPHL